MSFFNSIYLYIAAGGAFGAVTRYLISTWIYNKSEQVFPYGTFVVNLTGCFLLGLFYTLSLEKSVINAQFRTMITVGFIGAYTTFSTFSLETINLIKEGSMGTALLYVGSSVILGLFSVWLGIGAANFFNQIGERGEESDKSYRSGGTS
ncbi:fluoride efflux transporter CrcB [Candidatus Formimonas warabiya]|uniref:Fluoride-specific ion channel FluC n=1 Tax=Formimonas warabiya TaxID=1761012 RepID=A0A3G1KS07_FORW1|nr:fluoride efflux transporter CrcB [Candidatus Formimonas warabiya]ATW25230.1 hypothetical protein DCMF_11035 [Candidatus Formimonas warabiya]